MSQSNLSPTAQKAATDTIIEIDLKVQAEKGPDLRKDHPKSHGLVRGEFIVADDIPEALRVGIFARSKTYPIWVRFSNASEAEKRGKLKSDLEPDIRAMAIKLMNVEGEKVLDDEQDTQDFLLLNHPVFIVKDAEGFANLMKASVGQANEEELRSLEPTFAVLKDITSKQVANPLLIQYWSTTPYQFGSQSIKYSVKPHEIRGGSVDPQQSISNQQDKPNSTSHSENFLRKAMVKYLSEDIKDATFDFLVQFYVNDEKTPIEDPMQEWKEEDSPFIKLATVKIPAQKFDFEERKRLDEGLSFTPWHTLPEHQPLGSVNLARKKVYQKIAKSRRENIQSRLKEPQPYSEIIDDPQ
jgi:Catalase